MKLTELLINQKLIIQLVWGEKLIEFNSEVLTKDTDSVYMSPYMHNDKPLELNIVHDRGVVCNIFTDDPNTKERISWRNLEMTTVTVDNRVMYCFRSNVFNHVSQRDDRRHDNRIVIQLKGKVYDGDANKPTDILVHDISDVGVSFYAPNSFEPRTQQLKVTFSDTIEEQQFNVVVDCAIVRSNQKAGNVFYGCKLVGENKDFLLFAFVMKLMDKNKLKAIRADIEE